MGCGIWVRSTSPTSERLFNPQRSPKMADHTLDEPGRCFGLSDFTFEICSCREEAIPYGSNLDAQNLCNLSIPKLMAVVHVQQNLLLIGQQADSARQ